MKSDISMQPIVDKASVAVELVMKTLQRGLGGAETAEDAAFQAGAAAFRALNEEWIKHYYTLEPKDVEVLGDPEKHILRKGGHIFLAIYREQIVGCVALIGMGQDAMGRSVFELSKMAVAPRFRGFGIGRRMLLYATAQARLMGAGSLFLGSNSGLKDAVHLYESVGFRHVPADKLPPMHYARADVFMEMELRAEIL